MKKINIMRVRISTVPYKQVLSKIKTFLKDGKQHYIVTPNPEIMLEAGASGDHDEKLHHSLNDADLTLADGMGIKLASFLTGGSVPRITGADLVPDVLGIAEKNGHVVGIIKPNNSLSTTKELYNALTEQYPSLKFNIESVRGEGDIDHILCHKWRNKAPDVVFLTLGAPQQEKVLPRLLRKNKNIKLALAVGGAFDLLCGRIKRAPKLWRKLGIEWLWRLLKEPWRIKRVFNAIVVFPYYFLKWKYILPFFYRHNVACLLYTQRKGKYKILLVERKKPKGHWQLPQGGTEGENVKKAGSREIMEELNTDRFVPEKAYSLKTKYLFPDRMEKRKGGYKGQKQDLLIARFTGEDKDIKINPWEHNNWQWVDAARTVKYVHLSRKNKTRTFVNKFYEFLEESSKNKK